MEYYSIIKRNTFESVILRWINLEPIKKREVSHKLKDKYHILRHRYEIQKDGTDEPICSAPVETKTWRTDRWTQPEWEEGEGGRHGESNMEIYITICKIDSQW